jgi:hypothetical protein
MGIALMDDASMLLGFVGQRLSGDSGASTNVDFFRHSRAGLWYNSPKSPKA